MKSFVPFTEVEQKAVEKAKEKRESLATRFPLIFASLITFGLVSTYYGFEKLIDRVEFFTNNPWILLATGISTLVATGAVYRKLD